MSITEEIKHLKKEKNAVILAHYYVADEVQEIADYIGDSYYLSKAAQKTAADIIVFCGVKFMGESAAILNPEKKVLMQDLAVVCYINSTAEIKTYSDVCVTSANAVKIVRNLPNQNIFFIPDGNLGRYVAEQVPEKHIIFNDGYCPIHAAMSAEAVKREKEKHPEAKFLVHPECTGDLLKLADYIGSTSGIIDFAAEDDGKEYIIGTESGVLYELKKQNPDKTFYTLTENQICTDMKLITPEKVLQVLKEEINEVKVPEKVRIQAGAPLEKMLMLAR